MFAENPLTPLGDPQTMKRPYINIFLVILLIFSWTTGLLASEYYRLGRKYYISRNYDKARKMFQEDIKQYKRGNSYYFLGEIEKITGNYRKAEEYFLESLDHPTSSQYRKNAYWNLIVIAEQRVDYRALIRYCRLMEEGMPGSGARQKAESIINKSLWSNDSEAISHYRKAMNLKSQGKKDEAEEEFHEALREDSSFKAPRFELGIIAYEREEYDRAMRQMSRVIDAIPFYAEAHMIMADIQYRRRNYRSALDHLSGAVKYGFFGKSTRVMLIKKRGISAYRLGEHRQAEEDFRKLLKMGYGSRSIRSLLSATLVRQEKYSEAIPLLTTIYKEDPQNLSLIYQIGSLYYKIEDERYSHYFTRLWELTKTDPEQREKYHRAYEILIDHHYGKRNFQQITRIYASLPDNIRNHRLMRIAAISHYRQKEYDRSIELLDQLSLDREDRFILARACALSNRKERARELVSDLAKYPEMEEKIEKDPSLGPILLSIVRERQKKEEERKQKETGSEETKPGDNPTTGNNDDPGKE